LPVLLQVSNLSASAQLRVVTDAAGTAGADADEPVTGHASFSWTVRPDELRATIATAGTVLANVRAQEPEAPSSSLPESRLEEEFAALTATAPAADAGPKPVLVTLAGDFVPGEAEDWLEDAFGDAAPATTRRARARVVPAAPLTVRLGVPVAQAQVGFIAAAPGPREEAADAWRLLLYILSHGYEGRLGKKAIGDTGLVYYIETRYRSDGVNAWATLSSGVDPHKLDAFRSLMVAEIARLSSEPPTEAEVAEAKGYFLGRRLSGAQSNDELTQRLATEWLWYGELPRYEDLEQRLGRVRREDVIAAAAGLAAGTTITVTE
jgi:zinc protease